MTLTMPLGAASAEPAPNAPTSSPRRAGPWAYAAQGRADTPLGPVTLAVTDRGLAGLWFDAQAHHPGDLPAPVRGDHPQLQHARQALQAYWTASTACDTAAAAAGLPLDPQGTPFQQAVWRALASIGAGQTQTYGDVARRIGRPQAVRAVAAAIGRNPVSIFIPCHRVLGRDGGLTGYAGGLDRKAALLRHEGVALLRHGDVLVPP